jgi:hypothetical protein
MTAPRWTRRANIYECGFIAEHVNYLNKIKPVLSVSSLFNQRYRNMVLTGVNVIFINIHGVHRAGLSDFLSTWFRAAVFFSVSGAALSQEVPTVKGMSNQPAL